MLRRWLVVLVLAACLLPGATLAAPETGDGTTIVFVGGYGSTLATATRDFNSLRAALEMRQVSVRFAQYSYAGWDAQACQPLPYQDTDTAQTVEISKQRFLDMLVSLHTQCGAERIVVIGHSLGGLLAFHALADSPLAGVTDIVTVDSPLGGAPAAEITTCIESGLCVDGPVSAFLSGLYADWTQTGLDNAARVSRLAQAGTRVTAWGNERDCLYAPAVCLPFARDLVGAYDVRDTQWLGIERAMRRDYAPLRLTLSSVLNSHHIVLSTGAADLAADLFG
jgi:pimeloyl-ACP methyl ester carboxylesterase